MNLKKESNSWVIILGVIFALQIVPYKMLGWELAGKIADFFFYGLLLLAIGFVMLVSIVMPLWARHLRNNRPDVIELTTNDNTNK